jgi:hypothetical protein
MKKHTTSTLGKTKTFRQGYTDQNGSIVVSILIVSIFLTTVIAGLSVLASTNITRAKGRVLLLQAQYAAESGVDSAIARINNGNEAYSGTVSEVEILGNQQYRSTYQVSVVPGEDPSKDKIITATGKVYIPASSTAPQFSRTIEVLAQRTSTTNTLAIVSRNILEVGSGVKSVRAKDIYANGYIQLNKNTTDLIAENISVVDKNTGANNCSIGGTGNLVKPTSFSNPSQTKTNITVGFNNCLAPNNVSNSNFNVLANQTNMTKIQSTLIPWSYRMDNTYQNAGNCNDWTTGPSPRRIPSVANPKRTHYPNSEDNVATSCGTSGDLNLGSVQYNITDHAHVRANFCATNDCEPIFNNPDPAIKFVFVEGIINFGSIRTAPGSGPIVLVAYGADPPQVSTKVCPYGGAIYVGQGSPSTYTNAPMLYLLSVNGICLDKTKFGAQPALGGVSGKNIYVATNSGTPFDLTLDPLFPTGDIPVDLAWRAVRYRRL